MSFKEKIDRNKLPKHVAIIMDGNGRWAKQQGNLRVFGHKHATKAVKAVVEAAGEIGVKFLTLYTFSTENWNRPKDEVDALMELLIITINQEVDELNKNNVKLNCIGDRCCLSESVLNSLLFAEQSTGQNTGLNLILALSYSSRWEIVEAVKKISNEIEKGILSLENITQENFSNYLSTAKYPDPELLIRTGGELRISNFLLWQIAYSELFFTPKLWPDFRHEDFFEAICDYQQRERRFGKTSEQVQ